jgi:hypothetical protein
MATRGAFHSYHSKKSEAGSSDADGSALTWVGMRVPFGPNIIIYTYGYD